MFHLNKFRYLSPQRTEDCHGFWKTCFNSSHRQIVRRVFTDHRGKIAHSTKTRVALIPLAHAFARECPANNASRVSTERRTDLFTKAVQTTNIVSDITYTGYRVTSKYFYSATGQEEFIISQNNQAIVFPGTVNRQRFDGSDHSSCVS